MIKGIGAVAEGGQECAWNKAYYKIHGSRAAMGTGYL